MIKRIWNAIFSKKQRYEEDSIIVNLTDKVRELEEENLALHSIIDSYLAKENEEKTVTKDDITQYEEWLDSPQGDKLVQAYEDYYNTQEVAIEEDTTYTEDAKERMSKSKLWL